MRRGNCSDDLEEDGMFDRLIELYDWLYRLVMGSFPYTLYRYARWRTGSVITQLENGNGYGEYYETGITDTLVLIRGFWTKQALERFVESSRELSALRPGTERNQYIVNYDSD
jgi:hypothetical protein